MMVTLTVPRGYKQGKFMIRRRPACTESERLRKFYEKLAYRKVGGSFSLKQKAEEWIYGKELRKYESIS